jgi:hypothetical protein
MMRFLPVVVLFPVFFMAMPLFGQDRIVLNDGHVLYGKVESIDDKGVRYTPEDNPEAGVVLVPRENAYMVYYENGKKEMLNKPVVQEKQGGSQNDDYVGGPPPKKGKDVPDKTRDRPRSRDQGGCNDATCSNSLLLFFGALFTGFALGCF